MMLEFPEIFCTCRGVPHSATRIGFIAYRLVFFKPIELTIEPLALYIKGTVQQDFRDFRPPVFFII